MPHRTMAVEASIIALSVLAPPLSPVAVAGERGDGQLLVLSKMGLMYVGGREVPMQGGGRFGGGGQQSQVVEQAPVHYLIPPKDKQQGKCPVIMVPGMGLTSYLYLGTPDGRDGWAQLFAKAGHAVYVFDEPNNAVSGFEVGRFNAVQQGQAEASELPRFMLWANETTWRRWGIGPEPLVPFKDTRYPRRAHQAALRVDDARLPRWRRTSGCRGDVPVRQQATRVAAVGFAGASQKHRTNKHHRLAPVGPEVEAVLVVELPVRRTRTRPQREAAGPGR